jgi:Uma2 family endonuclease
MTTKPKLITADELLLMPDDGMQRELIRGVLTEEMPPGYEHGILVTRIGRLFDQFSEETSYGEVCGGDSGFLLERNPDTVRCPDVAWIAPGRLDGPVVGYPELAPDHVVEVKSPSNSNPEMAAKAAMWLSYGSRMVWVADPQPVTVTVYRPNASPVTLHEDDILDGGDVLPGFTTPVWRLFRRRR